VNPSVPVTPPPRPPRRHGLGRGLDALLAGSLDQDSVSGSDRPALLDLDPRRVRPNPEQPRRRFDPDALASLADSIRQHGLVHPIVVEPDGDHYRLVAGERRLRAALQASVATIPAIVRPASESGRQVLELALVENLHRQDLNPLEEAAAYARMADVFGLSHEAIALRLGRTRPAVTNAIRLLQLPPPLQQALADGTLSAGHGRALLAVHDPEAMVRLGQRVIAEGLSVRATEQLTQRARPAPRHPPRPAAPLSPDDDRLRRGFEDALALPVTLERRARGARLIIDCAGDEDLDVLYRRVGGRPL
jgi:ParB family chromosome partitioning protein